MMQNTGLILLVFAFVFAFIAAVFGTQPASPRWNVHFGWLAVTCWIASELIGGLARVYH
jgi:hypothetical protein